MNRIPLLMDCDPGHDDAAALFMALGSGVFDLQGITTVPGNGLLPNVTENALRLVAFLGEEIPVVPGCVKPLAGECRPALSYHGATALDGVILPLSERGPLRENAVDFMAAKIREAEGEMVIAALGPLTNIAALLLSYPELKGKIKRLCLMGGSTSGGNITPAAEFNIWHDPEAAAIVFGSGLPITMCGLDVTEKMALRPEEIEEVRHSGRVGALCAQLFDYCQDTFGGNGRDLVVHDAVVSAWLIKEGLFDTRRFYVEVDTGKSLSRGCTATYIRPFGVGCKEANIDVVVGGDRDGFARLFIDCIAKLG